MRGCGSGACRFGDSVWVVGNVTVAVALWCLFDMGSSVVMVMLCGCYWVNSRM